MQSTIYSVDGSYPNQILNEEGPIVTLNIA
jgi:hypothetical protein